MSVRVTCINKSNGNHENPHEAIESFGWVNEFNGDTGKSSLAQMVDFIDNMNGVVYVKNGLNESKCYTRQGRYRKFLQTYADRTPSDNLLRLMECVS